MSRIIRVLSIIFVSVISVQGHASIVLDPSSLQAVDVTNYFEGVTLLTESGTVDIDGVTVIHPLQLTGHVTGVVANGVFMESGSSSPYYWSAGPCCNRQRVLRANFASPIAEVLVNFYGDDTDTAILQGYDNSGTLLNEAIYRGLGWFNVEVTSASGSISYVLATFSDTGFIGKISYVPASIPEPATLALLGIALASLGATRRKKAI